MQGQNSDTRKKVRCGKCGKVIARGKLPADLNIICKCGHDNDLSERSHTHSFADRVMGKIEKK